MRVQLLKSLSLDIGDEMKYQDRLLLEMDDDFEKTGGLLGNIMNRMLRIGKGRHNYYIHYLGIFSVFFLYCSLLLNLVSSMKVWNVELEVI
jgi:blocked-early-in-transport protein 1